MKNIASLVSCLVTCFLILSLQAAQTPAGKLTADDIRDEVERVTARNARLQAKLSDRCSLADYRALVRTDRGTNVWSAAFQRAVDEHEIVVVPPSDAPYFVDRPLVIPSNRRIEATGATVRLLDGVKTILLRNRHTADGTLRPIPAGTRDANIAIVGGRWEDWHTGRVGYGASSMYDPATFGKGNFYGVSTLFLFNNCDHVSVTDATFVHCAGFAVQAGDGDAYRFERVRFDFCHADGLHLNGNLSRVLCRDVRGQVGDDLVALNAYDWLNSSVNFGPQRLIFCEDLELTVAPGTFVYPAIRLQPAKYRYADGSVVDCSISDVVFRRVKGVTTYKMYLQTPGYSVGGPREWAEVGSGGNIHFEQLSIDLDAPIDGLPQYLKSDPLRGHFAAFELGANLSSVHFRDVDIRFHGNRFPLSHLVTVGPKSIRLGNREVFDPYVTCRVDRVTFENVRMRGAPVDELVHETAFDDINGDGASSGRGTIGTLVTNGVVRLPDDGRVTLPLRLKPVFDTLDPGEVRPEPCLKAGKP